MHKIAILSSGVPLTFRAIAQAVRDGVIPHSEVVAVAANQAGAPIFTEAQKFGVSWLYLDGTTAAELDKQALAFFHQTGAEIIALIGYEKKIGLSLLQAFPNSILNLHSGPLPRFAGPFPFKAERELQLRTQEAVLAAGVPFSGPTIHVVDEEFDHGQILAHCPVQVRADDTPRSLNDRCNLAGIGLYVQVLRDMVYRLDHPEQL